MTDFGQRGADGDASESKQDDIITALGILHADVATTILALIDDIEGKLDTLQTDLTITEIDSILNISVNDSTWEAITVPAAGGSACKAIAASLLTETDWHFSHVDDGATSILIEGTLTMDIVKTASDVIGYAQTDSGSDTLQVVLLK